MTNLLALVLHRLLTDRARYGLARQLCGCGGACDLCHG